MSRRKFLTHPPVFRLAIAFGAIVLALFSFFSCTPEVSQDSEEEGFTPEQFADALNIINDEKGEEGVINFLVHVGFTFFEDQGGLDRTAQPQCPVLEPPEGVEDQPCMKCCPLDEGEWACWLFDCPVDQSK